MGLVYGGYAGRSDAFAPGSCSYETGFCPHGVDYDEFKAATETELVPGRVHEGTMGTFSTRVSQFVAFSMTDLHDSVHV